MWLPYAEKSTVLNFQHKRANVKGQITATLSLRAGTARETSKTSKNCGIFLGNSTRFLKV